MPTTRLSCIFLNVLNGYILDHKVECRDKFVVSCFGFSTMTIPLTLLVSLSTVSVLSWSTIRLSSFSMFDFKG